MITKEYLQQELVKRIDGYKRGVEITTDNIIAEMKSILVLVDALPDYEKEYNEALERFRAFKEKYYTKNTVIGDAIFDKTGEMQRDFESIFPELRESEDEKIRQQLLWLCKEWEHNPDRRTIPADIDNIKQIRRYLEKQIKNVVVYDGDSYESAKEKAWHSFSGKAPLVSEAKSIYDNGFSEGYQFGIHEEKPLKWTIHDEAVRKEAIACLEEWKRLIPHSSVEDYYNILNWLKKELSIHTEKHKEKKPAEWDEKDESIRKQLISICDEWLGGGYSARPCLNDIRWLKNLLENLKEPIPTEL